jgi:plastocyanin
MTVMRLVVACSLSVLDVALSKEHVVTFNNDPTWTVGLGVGYADMSIVLGQTLAFASHSGHDVVLLHTPTSGAYWDQCGQNGIAVGRFTSVWASTDFADASITTKHYTPPTCGEFYLACSVSAHCMYGQRIKVTVTNTDNSACGTPCSNAACVTTSSMETKTGVLQEVKPVANSRYWGQGPYSALTVSIGDSVIFQTGSGFHDVATVPSAADFGSCNMNSKTVVADWVPMQTVPTASCISSSLCCAASSCGTSGQYVTYNFTATTAGETYFVCSYGNGGHCTTGQKIRVTVPGTNTLDPNDPGSTNDAVKWSVQLSFLMWLLAMLG